MPVLASDNLGSVRDIVSTTGSELDHVVYDSFGNIVTETDAANGDRFKFAGMQYDATTGQYYDHARWYGSEVGRFLTQDPEGFSAGDTDLYRYVRNAPIDLVDPSGEQQVVPNPPLQKKPAPAAPNPNQAMIDQMLQNVLANRRSLYAATQKFQANIKAMEKQMLIIEAFMPKANSDDLTEQMQWACGAQREVTRRRFNCDVAAAKRGGKKDILPNGATDIRFNSSATRVTLPAWHRPTRSLYEK